MITRHKASGIRNGIGLALCALLGACALTSAPVPTSKPGYNTPISLSFSEIELRATLQMLASFAGTNIVVAEDVPNASITFRADNVPVGFVIENLASCVGARADFVSDELIRILPVGDNETVAACVDVEVSAG